VDAIVGAQQQMHTIITELCTGCELCLPPCPVDCIAMVPAAAAEAVWDEGRADSARERYERRRMRLGRRQAERAVRAAARAGRNLASPQAKRAAVQAALARARAKRAAHGGRR
jgi:electron transport complex protein RnfB